MMITLHAILCSMRGNRTLPIEVITIPHSSFVKASTPNL